MKTIIRNTPLVLAPHQFKGQRTAVIRMVLVAIETGQENGFSVHEEALAIDRDRAETDASSPAVDRGAVDARVNGEVV